MSYADPNQNDFDPNDGLVVAALTTISTFTAIIVLVLVALASAGCAHLRPAPETCATRVQAALVNCVPMGQQTHVAEDGVAVVFAAACDIDTPTPKFRLIGFVDSPTLAAEAAKAGAKEDGTCLLGEIERRVIVMEKALPDTRASEDGAGTTGARASN